MSSIAEMFPHPSLLLRMHACCMQLGRRKWGIYTCIAGTWLFFNHYGNAKMTL